VSDRVKDFRGNFFEPEPVVGTVTNIQPDNGSDML